MNRIGMACSNIQPHKYSPGSALQMIESCKRKPADRDTVVRLNRHHITRVNQKEFYLAWLKLAERLIFVDTMYLRKNKDGSMGGLVSTQARIASDAMLSENSLVFGKSRVDAGAKMESSVLYGSALLGSNAKDTFAMRSNISGGCDLNGASVLDSKVAEGSVIYQSVASNMAIISGASTITNWSEVSACLVKNSSIDSSYAQNANIVESSLILSYVADAPISKSTLNTSVAYAQVSNDSLNRELMDMDGKISDDPVGVMLSLAPLLTQAMGEGITKFLKRSGITPEFVGRHLPKIIDFFAGEP